MGCVAAIHENEIWRIMLDARMFKNSLLKRYTEGYREEYVG
jgi:hypothetical protein